MTAAVRSRPALFRALGKTDPPETVDVDGRRYERIDIFKHDSWAATARYRSGDRDIVCKFNRVQSILGLPMRWLGRILARREFRALRRLTGTAGIPPVCGPVSAEGRPLPNAVAHDYVAGHPLGRHEPVDADFFPRLLVILETVHAHRFAYMDLHKRENILIGDDGKPWLIDFQVCFRLGKSFWSRSWPARKLLASFQKADLYHFAKHVQHLRPEQLSELDIPGGGERPGWIGIHRLVAVPWRKARRWLLTQLGIRGKSGQAITEAFAEDAFRAETQPMVASATNSSRAA
jgi:hypothetical protein